MLVRFRAVQKKEATRLHVQMDNLPVAGDWVRVPLEADQEQGEEVYGVVVGREFRWSKWRKEMVCTVVVDDGTMTKWNVWE